MTAENPDGAMTGSPAEPDIAVVTTATSGVATAEGVQPDAPSETSAPSPMEQLEALDPQPTKLVLSTGTEIRVLPLKTRQFFKMLRIVTRGGANVLSGLRLTADMTDEAFATQLIGLVVFSIPEAEDEAVEWIRSMVEAADESEEAADRLTEELENPEIEDTVSILEAVMRRESADLKALGKRLMAMFRVAEKAGQTKVAQSSSKDSHGSST